MQRRWYRLDSNQLPRGVVVIDATLATGPLWEGPILSVLEELRERLPASAHPEVVFLGDRRSHPLSTVLNVLLGKGVSAGSIDYRQQLGRFPVVGPFLREWVRTSPRPVVLITNSPVHDLDDWAVAEVLDALVVYRLTGSERLTRPPFREIGFESDLGLLVEHLSDPLEEVRVGGNGVFAADWQSADLTWENGTLRGPGVAADTMQLLLFHPDGHEPRAELRRASGTIVRCPLAPVAAPAPPEPITLSDADASVMRNWRSGRSFFCAECPVAHAPGQLWCRSGPGKAIVAALGGRPRGTTWAMKLDRNWIATPAPRGIAILEDSVVVNRGAAWEAYSLVDGQWNLTDPPPLLIPLGENDFLLPG